MYGGLALGAPPGIALHQHLSLNWAFAAGGGLPLLALLALPLVQLLPAVPPAGTARLPFYRVVSAI